MQTIGKNRDIFGTKMAIQLTICEFFLYPRWIPIKTNRSGSQFHDRPHYTFLGLPDTVIKESVLRIKSALKTHG